MFCLDFWANLRNQPFWLFPILIQWKDDFMIFLDCHDVGFLHRLLAKATVVGTVCGCWVVVWGCFWRRLRCSGVLYVLVHNHTNSLDENRQAWPFVTGLISKSNESNWRALADHLKSPEAWTSGLWCKAWRQIASFVLSGCSEWCALTMLHVS